MISEAACPRGPALVDDVLLLEDLEADLEAARREDCQVGEEKESMAGDD